jgi:hypothetical protein
MIYPSIVISSHKAGWPGWVYKRYGKARVFSLCLVVISATYFSVDAAKETVIRLLSTGETEDK